MDKSRDKAYVIKHIGIDSGVKLSQSVAHFKFYDFYLRQENSLECSVCT
jgi:hypothetical protein